MSTAQPSPSDAVAVVPDVAVVLIGHNDVTRLSAAVESVLAQTLDNLELIIVDDASTDGMGELADEWAARSPKIRAVHLPENSGGCSRPRNVGLEHVRAGHVMFLDSDDVLERHACKNLLLALEAADADFVGGRCVRVDMDSGRESPWFRSIYAEPIVVRSISELPDLLNDTLCTNKLYKMSFLDKHGIRFPEGLHYEDLAFTAQAYCSATTIALIPEAVYYWRIYRSNEQVSIHMRRSDIRNFRDRLAIHRIINAFLEREGRAEIKELVDGRFLRIELRIYLGEMAERDPEYQQEWISLASEYLREMPLSRIMDQERACRLTTYLVREADLALAIEAAALWLNARVTLPLVERDDRLYFADAHLDEAAGREAMDVTWLRLRTANFSDLRLYSEVTHVAERGRRIEVQGFVVDQLHRFPRADKPTVRAELRRQDKRPSRPIVLAVPNAHLEGDRLHFRVKIDTRTLVRGRQRESPAWFLRMRVIAPAGDPSCLPAARRSVVPLDPDPGGRVHPEVSGSGMFFLRDDRPPERRPLIVRIRGRLGRTAPARRVRSVVNGRQLKGAVYRHLLRRLPLRRDTVVFESHLGKQYSDSPKYLYEKLVELGLPYRVVWSYARRPERFPDAAVKVRRDSWRYYYEVARAGYLIDNQGFPAVVVRRSGQRCLQTWHGTPFKRMGIDYRGFARNSAKAEQLKADVSRWDDFVVQSTWSEDTFRHAFGLKCRMVRSGYPRNDPLQRADDAELRAELRKRLGLPEGKKILLYAPTFRRYPPPLVIGDPANAPRLDIATFERAVGDDWFVLFRAHYLDRMNLPRRYAAVARDVSSHDDITELLLVADALLTDYSSVMFDYAITGRPMGFYTSDYELYRQLRGAYFDLPEQAPGPMLTNTDEIVDWLSDLEETHGRYQERYRAFRAKYCEFEDGTASERILREFFA